MAVQLQRLIEDASEHVFLNELDEPFYSSGGGYRIRKRDHISIFQSDGTWLIHDFKEDSTRNALQFISDRYGLSLNDRQQLFQAAQTVCELDGLHLDNYTTGKKKVEYRPRKLLKKKQKKAPREYIPNRGREPKQITDHQATELGPVAMEYVQKKTGASPELLREYGIKEITHLGGTKINDIVIMFQAGDNIKYKRPHAPKDQKERWLKSCGNYVFGWDQLPAEKIGTLIIAPGETDTIALNQILRNTDIRAICLNSETTRITTEMIQVFKQKAEDIVCLFDNDSTGAKAMQRNFREHELPYIDIARVVNDPAQFPDCEFENGRNITLNDVCDLLAYYGEDLTYQLIVGAPQVKWHSNEFDRYLSPKQLQDDIGRVDRLITQAPTGAGKSTVGMQLEGKTIMAFPTITLAEQQQAACLKTNGTRPPIVGGGHDQDQRINHQPLIIAVWDSLHRLEYLLPDSTLIVDEAHLLSDAAGYRLRACNDIWHLSHIAKKTVHMSATPVIFPGFDLRKYVNTGKRQIRQVQAIEYTGNLDALELPKETGLHIIRINDIERLQVMQKKVPPGIQSALITSKHREGNEYYDKLIEGIRLATKQDQPFYMFATSLIDVGISITEPVTSIHNLTPGSPRETIQIIARARMNGSNNEAIKIYEYWRKGRKPKNAGVNLVDYEHELREKARRIQASLQALESIGTQDAFTLKNDHAELVFKRNDQWHISEPYIQHMVSNLKTGSLTLEQRNEALRRIDADIDILPVKQIELSKEPSKELKDAREQKRLQKIKARALYLDHSDQIQAIVMHKSQDHQLREEIRRRYGPIMVNKDIFYQDHKELFDQGLFNTLIWRHFELLNIGVSEAEAIEVIATHGNKKSFGRVYNQYLIAYKKRPRQDQKDKVRALWQAVRSAKQNGKYEFTAPEINKLVKAAGYDMTGKKTNRDHLDRIRWVFNVEWVKKDVYRIGKKHSKASLKRMTKTDLNLSCREFKQLFDSQQVMTL